MFIELATATLHVITTTETTQRKQYRANFAAGYWFQTHFKALQELFVD